MMIYLDCNDDLIMDRWRKEQELTNGSESENDFRLKLNIHVQTSEPVIDYFTKKGKIRFVQAECSITEV